MKVIVCGGRYFKDYALVDRELKALAREAAMLRTVLVIVEGGQKTTQTHRDGSIEEYGADYLASRWCEANPGNLHHIQVKANWKAFGRAAGPIRNQKMIAEEHPDLVLAFPGGNGTADMVRRARVMGIEVREVKS